MAKKPLLDATSRPKTAYSDWTKGYRTSDNVEDRRGAQSEQAYVDYVGGMMKRMDKIQPPKTRDGSTGSGVGGAAEGYDDGATGYDHSAPTSTTRKVTAEEAIRRTNIERK
jgi:hypothetical protein